MMKTAHYLLLVVVAVMFVSIVSQAGFVSNPSNQLAQIKAAADQRVYTYKTAPKSAVTNPANQCIDDFVHCNNVAQSNYNECLAIAQNPNPNFPHWQNPQACADQYTSDKWQCIQTLYSCLRRAINQPANTESPSPTPTTTPAPVSHN